jgi:ketosteroid isomerase-like protein/pimeloyl-ACP methyl ester carboxylesterase
MRHVALVLSTLVAALLLIVGSPSAALAGQDDTQILTRIRNQVQDAERRRDVGRLRAVYADDVVLVTPDFPPVVGADAVAEFMQLLFDQFQLENHYSHDTTELAGDSAVEHGMVRQVSAPGSDEEPTTEVRPYRWVYRRDAAGSWKQSQITWGEPGPPGSTVPRLPTPTGSYAIGFRNLYFVDRSRSESFTPDPDDHREVAVQVWYPAVRTTGRQPAKYQSLDVSRAAAAFLGWPIWSNSFYSLVETNAVEGAEYADRGAPFPVLIYNHGYSGFTTVHTALLEDLASHGYVVASVGHAYESALFIGPDGDVTQFSPDNAEYRARVDEASGEIQEAFKDSILLARNLNSREHWYRELLRTSPKHQESARIWAADIGFVIDRLQTMNRQEGEFAGVLDLERIGVLGHSLGGAAAGQITLTDPRVKAGINIDGFQFGDLIDRPLTDPFMFVGAQRPWAGDSTTANDVFFQRAESSAYVVLIAGFTHGTFSDLPLFENVWGEANSAVDGKRALTIQRAYIRAFFDRHLRQRRAPLLDGPSSAFPEVFFAVRNDNR